MDYEEIDSSELISSLFNGPAIAGVGATTDAGLSPAKFHVVPWAISDTTEVNHVHSLGTISLPIGSSWNQYKAALLYRIASHNVVNVFGIEGHLDNYPAVDMKLREDLAQDAVAIVFLALSYNYYSAECREWTSEEKKNIPRISLEGMAEVLTVEKFNRAATFIMARMHTKYQTNHVLGGFPLQASMASAVRAFYGIGIAKTAEATARMRCIADVLHWALHPFNERLLIPAIIAGSHIDSAFVHTQGPEPQLVALEEYFAIRSRTPPASTHHFYVCAAAVRHLQPLGVLRFLPQPSRLADVRTGFALIAAHGARLHPAARYWGLERITSNQKLVEPLAADLGYAIRRLMPGSSLAASPILMKEDALDSGWKTFIDALRSALDKKGGELIDEETMKAIKAHIAPAETDSAHVAEVAALIEAPPVGGATAGGDTDDDEDEEEEEQVEERVEEQAAAESSSRPERRARGRK
jgi:hypothetical protein